MAIQRTYFEDGRSTIGKLRRIHLNRILDAEGVDHPPSMPAVTAREMISSMGIDVEKYVERDDNGVVHFIWPQMNEPENQHKNVDDMRRQDLMEFCSKMNISFAISDRKEVLREKIKEHMSEYTS